jgi:hypothetical protein
LAELRNKYEHSIEISLSIVYYQAILPHDTQKDSALRQYDVLRKMTISQRAEMTFQLSDNLREIVRAGIRQRHPEYTPDQITQAVLNLVMDNELVSKAFGGRVLDP